LEKGLKEKGVSITSPTIQAILVKRALGRREERCTHLETAIIDRTLFVPSKEQVAACEKLNPRFRARFGQGMKPGESLVQETIRLGDFKGIGLVKAQVVIDCVTLQTWVLVHLPEDDQAPLHLLRDKVMPDLHKRYLRVKIVSTPSSARYGRREHGGDYHEYVEEKLKAWHHYPDPPTRRTNGLVEAFKLEIMPFVKALVGKRRKWKPGELQKAVEGWVDETEADPKARLS